MTRQQLNPVTPVRLAVDPVSCEAVGLCAQLAPTVVQLDRWGYPILPDRLATTADRDLAMRAVRGCPRRALALLLIT